MVSQSIASVVGGARRGSRRGAGAHSHQAKRVARLQRTQRERERRHAPLPRAQLPDAQHRNVPAIATDGATRAHLGHHAGFRIAELIVEHIRNRLLHRGKLRGVECLERVGRQHRAASRAVGACGMLQQRAGRASEQARSCGEHRLWSNKDTRATDCGCRSASLAPKGDHAQRRVITGWQAIPHRAHASQQPKERWEGYASHRAQAIVIFRTNQAKAAKAARWV